MQRLAFVQVTAPRLSHVSVGSQSCRKSSGSAVRRLAEWCKSPHPASFGSRRASTPGCPACLRAPPPWPQRSHLHSPPQEAEKEKEEEDSHVMSVLTVSPRSLSSVPSAVTAPRRLPRGALPVRDSKCRCDSNSMCFVSQEPRSDRTRVFEMLDACI